MDYESPQLNELVKIINYSDELAKRIQDGREGRTINEALYTASETGFFECESMSVKDAIKAWLIVYMALGNSHLFKEEYEEFLNKFRM